VQVVARPLPGAVQFSVADDGPGIDAGRQEQLFEPLQSGEPGGTGLGLAVARAIVRAHGGDLWLDSGTPGGTVFACRLPARVHRGEGEVVP
jgi:signal transduction histidine kinase